MIMARTGGVAAAAVLLLAGCAGATVTGHGVALGNHGAVRKVVPPIFPHMSVPSGPVPAGGVLYTFAAGHVQMVMPAQPVERAQTDSVDGIKETLHLVLAADDSGVTVVASADLSQPVPLIALASQMA